MLRAYDKGTGREAGAVFMPAPQSGTPMTYSLNGRQHIVVAVSGACTPASTWRTGCLDNSVRGGRVFRPAPACSPGVFRRSRTSFSRRV
jgi:hypothetical protein